jgi:hypothetical protein
VIGTGGRARGLMTLLKRLPGNEMVAIGDVYERRPPGRSCSQMLAFHSTVPCGHIVVQL